jgi:hypothetical protein
MTLNGERRRVLALLARSPNDGNDHVDKVVHLAKAETPMQVGALFVRPNVNGGAYNTDGFQRPTFGGISLDAPHHYWPK